MTDPASWLRARAPILRYHSAELYGAVAVEALTDFWFEGGPGAPRSTQLKRAGQKKPIADANPVAPLRLSVQLLDKSYGDSDIPATERDFLDAHNLAYQADAAISQLNPDYRDVVYGTFAPRGDGKPGGWLQYWFFFYFNSKAALFSRLGPHEGDWEMIQVRVDGTGKPEELTYAQHAYYRKSKWDSELVQKVDGRPVVYVALGSHASYFEAGRHPIELPHLGSGLIDDICDDGGREVTPRLVVIEHEPPPPWASWQGRWGASTEGRFRSPEGPARHDVWGKPDASHKKAKWEKPLERDLETVARDYDPDFNAWREGDLVHVTYRLPSENESEWLAELVVAVYEAEGQPPREHVFDAAGASPDASEAVFDPTGPTEA